MSDEDSEYGLPFKELFAAAMVLFVIVVVAAVGFVADFVWWAL